jgi:hypothetical protein
LKDLGVILSESTVNGCFSRLGEALRPLYGRVREIVLSSGYIQADETVLPVISKHHGYVVVPDTVELFLCYDFPAYNHYAMRNEMISQRKANESRELTKLIYE